MTSLQILCVSCGHPLSESLFFAKADLRFCAACLSVTRVAVAGALATPRAEAVTPVTHLEMTGATVLRLAAELESDPSLQALFAVDADLHWTLQLPPLQQAALTPYRDASAVLLARDAQLALVRPTGGRRLL